MKSIPKIVFSGGPCGGKTLALRFIKEHLIKEGFDVLTVTEVASEILAEGFERNLPVFEFQKAIAQRQIEKENSAEKSAENLNNPVILCDRGLMDCRVYLNDDDFEKLKSQLGLSEIDLRDRYDAVFHLDSTSNSNKEIYIQRDIRIENKDEACILNEKSLRAWCGNPHYRFIPVCETFDEKMELLIKEVNSFLGIPKHLEIERKFLIKYPDLELLNTLPCCKSEIEQTYMISSNNERFRLRKRGENGNYIYIKTEKRKISDTVREETETRLTKEEYENLLNSHSKIGSISKERYCVMYNGTYYEIDIFPFWKNQAYLEIELNCETDKITIPKFLTVIEEVTYKPEYRNIALCQRIPSEIERK
ncbi:MAG: AAA family ATPase [Ruminococcus sp.]